MQYIKKAPDEVARIINANHIVGNHSTTHPSNCAAITREELAKEILGVHNYMRVNFGYECKYFRFPTGRYSQNALELVDSVGYRSVFWSIAHADWDPENQPGEEVTFKAQGRHDPCVLPRAVPIVESMAAITILDCCLMQGIIGRKN